MKIPTLLITLFSFVTIAFGQATYDFCPVCGVGNVMNFKDAKLSETKVLGQLGLGERVTCGQVDRLGRLRLIPLNVCIAIQISPSFQDTCGCAPPGVPVSKPASKPAPMPSGSMNMNMNMKMNMMNMR